jgi:arylsulfatase
VKEVTMTFGPHYHHRQWPAGAHPGWFLLVVVLVALVPSRAASVSNPPNILLVVADDLGWSDLHCYGGEIATPSLDQLATHGVRFTQFYNTGRCWPTRASILTGYYPQQVRRDHVPGIRSGGAGARPQWARLLPEFLRSAGYRNYHSGKWHIDGPRLTAGFDRSYTVEDHDRYFAPRRHLEDDAPLPPPGRGQSFHVTDAIADHAIRCLAEHAREYSERPFFHYLCFTAPHFPLQAPAADIARYQNTYQVGWDRIRQRRWARIRGEKLSSQRTLPASERDLGPPYHFPDALAQLGALEVNRPVPWEQLTSAQQDFQSAKMAIHAAMIHQMDRALGRVLDQLRTMDAWANTLILFLSDNGASAEIMIRGDGHEPSAPPGSAATFLCLGPGWSSASNTPFRRHKTWVHEGGIATPLIVHWPAGIRSRGELRRSPAHVIDLVPTILEITGVSRDDTPQSGAPRFPGRTLAGAFHRDARISRDCLWWLHEGNRAIRVGDWKLVAANDQPWELYHLKRDRGETRDLATRRPGLAARLENLWEEHRDRFFEAALAE